MTEYEIYAYEAYRKREYPEKEILEESIKTSWQDSKVDEYIRFCTFGKPNFTRFNREDTLEFLGLTEKHRPTLLSLLLFGIYPQGLFPRLSVAVSVIPGTEIGDTGLRGERFTDSKRFEGTLDEMLKDTMLFMENNLKTSIIIDSSTGMRNDVPEIPLAAIREAVLNALIHRDYSRYTREISISVNIFKDRIEIKNPGGIYGSENIDMLGVEYFNSRNPGIVQAMEILHQSENRYSGIPTMRRLLKESGLPEPVFDSSHGFFSVTFFRPGEKPEPVPDSVFTEEPIAQKKLPAILTFLRTPRTRKEIADYLGIKNASQAVSKHITPLVEQGLVKLDAPERPSARNQRFSLSSEGETVLQSEENN